MNYRAVILLFSLTTAIRAVSAPIIPATNAPTAVWSVAGVPGGIPYRSVTTNLGSWSGIDTNGSTDMRAGVVGAISSHNSAPCAVLLPAGHLKFGSQFTVTDRDNWTLRGTTVNGTNATWIDVVGSQSAAFELGNGPSWVNTVNITNGGTQGSSNIWVTTAASYTILNEAAIDMQDADWVTVFGTGTGSGPTTNANASNSQVGKSGAAPAIRAQVHYCHITGVISNRLSFWPPLPFALDDTRAPQISRSSSRCLTNFGFENLTINFTNHTGTYPTRIQGAANFWFKNVNIVGWSNNFAIWMRKCVNPEIRGCSLYNPRVLTTKGIDHGYGILCDGLSGFLITDNIFYDCQSSFLLQNGCTGGVIAYNVPAFGRYWYLSADPIYDGRWLLHDISGNHTPFPCYNLFEGNYTTMFQSDYYYGPSGWGTIFRNRIAATSAATTTHRIGVSIDARQRYYSVVGNSIGTINAEPNPLYLALPNVTRTFATPGTITSWIYDPGSTAYGDSANLIYRLGYPSSGNNNSGSGLHVHDNYVKTNTLRHGNWDAANNGIIWDSTISDHTISNSMFLSSAPYFFGTNFAWPPYGPSNAPISMSDDLDKLPAGWRLHYGTNLPYGELAVSTNSVDFGIVIHPQPLTWTGDEPVLSNTFWFTNIGTANLTLTQPRHWGGAVLWFKWNQPGGTGIDPFVSAILAPGQSTNIVLVFRPFPDLGPELEVPRIIRPQFVFTNGGGVTISSVARTANPTTNFSAFAVNSPSGFDFSTNGGVFKALSTTTPYIPGQSGEAYFSFILTNRSVVSFSAIVQATNVDNSFVVGVDGQTLYPNGVWDLTTTGNALGTQTLTLRGLGTEAYPAGDPYVLEEGPHFVVVFSETAGTTISNLTANVIPVLALVQSSGASQGGLGIGSQ